MSVATTGKGSLVPKVRDDIVKIGTALPTFSRTGTATRVNSSGLIETVTADIPRFDYNPVTLALKGLLIEEARTNLALYSQAIGGEGSPSVWNLSGGASLMLNNATAPDGTATGTTLTAISGSSQVMQAFTGLTHGAVYAFSVFLKAAASSVVLLYAAVINVYAEVNLATGTVTLVDGSGSPGLGVAATIEPFADSWYRATVVFTVSGTSETMQIRANAAGNFHVWGAQFENTSGAANGVGAKSSSYIPTTSAAVARGADTARVTGLGSADWFDTAARSLYAEWSIDRDNPLGNTSPGVVALTDGASGNNRVTLYHSPAGDSSGYIVFVSGANVANQETGAGYTYGATRRQALGLAANNIAMSVDGGAVVSDTSNSLPTVTQIDIGDQFHGNHKLGGHVRKIKLYDENLSQADLITLSGGGAITTDPVLEFDFTTADLEEQTGSLDHARIAYHNPARDVTITASSEAEGFPGDAAQRPDTYERWRPTSLPATWLVPFGSAQAIDYMLFAAHDLGTKECSVKAQYSVDGSTWYDASDTFTPDNDDDSPILLLFSPQIAASWRPYIAGVGSPTEAPTIGVIQVGRILTMQRSIYGGHAPINLGRETVLHQALSRGGNFLGQNIRRAGLVGAASFRYLTPVWVRENFDPFVQAARKYPYAFAWRPGDYPDEVSYVWTGDDIRPSNMGVREFMQVAWPMRGFDSEG